MLAPEMIVPLPRIQPQPARRTGRLSCFLCGQTGFGTASDVVSHQKSKACRRSVLERVAEQRGCLMDFEQLNFVRVADHPRVSLRPAATQPSASVEPSLEAKQDAAASRGRKRREMHDRNKY